MKEEGTTEIKIVSVNSNNHENGIFKFENCKFRSRDETTKNASCCSAKKISGFYCWKINKFPVNFAKDCENCTFFEK